MGTLPASGIAANALRNVMADISDIRENGTSEINSAYEAARWALYQLEVRSYLRKEQGVFEKPEEDHNTEARIPFDEQDVLILPVGVDGHIIPSIPDIKDGFEYQHDGKHYPSGPAFFVDPETKIHVYTKDKGWEEGVMIKDLDWTQVRSYKKFYAIDDSIEEFGLF